MRSLLTFMLLAAAMLPTLGHAQWDQLSGDWIELCDRTPQVRDALIASAGVNDLTVRVDAEGNRCHQLRVGGDDHYLRRMDLSGQGITALKSGDFAGLPFLKTLNLCDNELTTLPEGLFTGSWDVATGGQELNLCDNELTTLPEGAFAGLHGLKILNLSGNQLTTLPEGLFTGLSTPPAGYFGVTEPAKLERLYLQNNQLTALPEGLFTGLPLVTLDLSDNQLTTLPEKVFYGTRIVELDLSHNRLAILPKGVFGANGWQYGAHDGELDLRYNHLVGLTEADPYWGPSPRRLYLGGQTEPPDDLEIPAQPEPPIELSATVADLEARTADLEGLSETNAKRIVALEERVTRLEDAN